jgi:hypothetical protein
MGKGNKRMLKIVQVREDKFFQGLARIADSLNRLGELQGEELSVWKEVESIVEVMTDQPRQNSVYTRKEERESRRGKTSLLTSLSDPEYWSPGKQRPLPSVASEWFNQLANKYPVTLNVRLAGDSRDITVGHGPPDSRGHFIVWLLWAYYFQGEGWKRLKRCPHCKRWFVDQNRNRNKVHCSNDCKWKFWSRERKREHGHYKR